MIKIKGDRVTGKTTKLIRLAHENNAIIVVPTYQHVNVILDMAKEMGYKFGEIQAIPFQMFAKNLYSVPDGRKYVIDEIDECLAHMGVIAYTEYEKPLEYATDDQIRNNINFLRAAHLQAKQTGQPFPMDDETIKMIFDTLKSREKPVWFCKIKEENQNGTI